MTKKTCNPPMVLTGLRNLSLDSAARAVELFMADGQPVTIFDVLPSLKKFKHYFCQGCEKA